MSAPAPAATAAAGHRTLVRDGMLGLLGAAVTGAGGFALTLTVTRALPHVQAGLYFTAVAVFSIGAALLTLGADTGLVRALPGLAARLPGPEHAGARRDRQAATVLAAAVPVLVAGLVAATAVALLAGPACRATLPPATAAQLAPLLRTLAPFLVVGTLSVVLLNGASRGLGAMRTFTLLQQVLLPLARPLLLLAAVTLGLGLRGAVLSWALPLLVTAGFAVLDVRRRLRGAPSAWSGGWRAEVAPFWRATAPRGAAAVFEVLMVWADVVLVTALRGPAEAAIYAGASRFVTSATLAMQAVRLAVAPALARAFGVGDRPAAAAVHRVSALATTLTTWPVYLLLAVFSPGVLALLGPGFVRGWPALSLLSLAMLGVVATGNANTVLNMAGRSDLAARNTFLAVAAMLALDVALVPRFGMLGAAVGWSVAMLADAAFALWQIRTHLGLRSLDGRWRIAAAATVLAVGAPASAVAAVLGRGLPGVLVAVPLAAAAQLAWLAAARRPLGLQTVLTTMRRPRP